MNHLKISNSYFEKSSERRQIRFIDDDTMYITEQKYNFVEKTPKVTTGSHNFKFDGQIFSRSKEDGGNVPSAYYISGKSKTISELKSERDFLNFKRLFKFVVNDAVTSPIIVTDKEIRKLTEAIKNA